MKIKILTMLVGVLATGQSFGATFDVVEFETYGRDAAVGNVFLERNTVFAQSVISALANSPDMQPSDFPQFGNEVIVGTQILLDYRPKSTQQIELRFVFDMVAAPHIKQEGSDGGSLFTFDGPTAVSLNKILRSSTAAEVVKSAQVVSVTNATATQRRELTCSTSPHSTRVQCAVVSHRI